jgi:hypothetical protein
MGRNILRSARLANLNAGAVKNVSFLESQTLQLRAEFYNTSNTRYFGSPDATLSSAKPPGAAKSSRLRPMIFSRGEAQEPAGAYAGLAFVAVVVREQNGYGRMEHNRAEQQFEFFRSVFREPVGGWGLGGYGSHDAILDCLVDLETGDVEDAGHPFPQTLPRMAASHHRYLTRPQCPEAPTSNRALAHPGHGASPDQSCAPRGAIGYRIALLSV